jgi:hypothetical protein
MAEHDENKFRVVDEWIKIADADGCQTLVVFLKQIRREHPESNYMTELLEVARKARCKYPHIAPGCTFLPMEGISNHTELCKESRAIVDEIEEKKENK